MKMHFDKYGYGGLLQSNKDKISIYYLSTGIELHLGELYVYVNESEVMYDSNHLYIFDVYMKNCIDSSQVKLTKSVDKIANIYV